MHGPHAGVKLQREISCGHRSVMCWWAGMCCTRRVLSDERLAASKAADAARDAQLKLAEAVRQWVAQGVPIPFSVQSE